jgi:hypothetical protein
MKLVQNRRAHQALLRVALSTSWLLRKRSRRNPSLDAATFSARSCDVSLRERKHRQKALRVMRLLPVDYKWNQLERGKWCNVNIRIR